MRKLLISSLVLGLWGFSPLVVFAQEPRVPYAGSKAVGFEVGRFLPSDDEFQSSPTANGLLEYYVSPRVSLRADLGWSDPGHKRQPVDSLRQVPLRFSVNYNWERGRWHPFLGTGVGIHFLQSRQNGERIGQSDMEPGVNVGGGLEYFLNRELTLKGEGRYYAIGTPQGGSDPSGWAVTGGIKTYF